MVWMITVIGFTLGIPDTVMGLTFIAAGVSVPDALSGIAVVREGIDILVPNHCTRDNNYLLSIHQVLPQKIKIIRFFVLHNYQSLINLGRCGPVGLFVNKLASAPRVGGSNPRHSSYIGKNFLRILLWPTTHAAYLKGGTSGIR